MRLEAPDYVVLVVEELDRSLRFYTEVLGLELRSRSGAFAQLETGQTRLALYERAAMAETLGRAIRAPDRDAPGFDHAYAMEPGSFAGYVQDVRAAFEACRVRPHKLGTQELDVRERARRGLYAARDLPAVQVLDMS